MMGRQPEDGGVNVRNHAQSHATSSPGSSRLPIQAAAPPRPTLATLPAELHVAIFASLPLSSLLSLSLVCKALRATVEANGWDAWLLHSPQAQRHCVLRTGRGHDGRGHSDARKRVQEILSINSAWNAKALLGRQYHFVELPPPAGKGSSAAARGGSRTARGRGRGSRQAQDRGGLSYTELIQFNQGMPLLCLHGSGLYLAFKSTISIWSWPALHTARGLRHHPPQVIALPRSGGTGSSTAASAWHDISAMQVLGDGIVAVGRVDGWLEIARLGIEPTEGEAGPKRREGDAPALDRYSLLSSYRPESSGTTELQCISYLPGEALLTAAWKDGTVAILRAEKGFSGLNLVRKWTIASRPWSVHLGQLSEADGGTWWLAVGCQGKDFLRVSAWDRARLSSSLVKMYANIPYHNFSLQLYDPALPSFADSKSELEPRYRSLRVSRDATPPSLSAYALASARMDDSALWEDFPPHHLFAGCYDGSVRVWDVRTRLSSREVAKERERDVQWERDMERERLRHVASSSSLQSQSQTGTPSRSQANATASDRPTPSSVAVVPPIRRYTDRYDPSAVYSITLGVGPRSASFAIGTARHGNVKVFSVHDDAQQQQQRQQQQMVEIDDEFSQHTVQSQQSSAAEPKRRVREGYNLFCPAPPADTPTYSIVGEHGRLFCAGQGRVWELDARGRLGVEAQESGRRSNGQDEEKERSGAVETSAKRGGRGHADGPALIDRRTGLPAVEDVSLSDEDDERGRSVAWYEHGVMEVQRTAIG